ncbi:CPBP family intramembrane metalloprotease [Candidatus Bipolaricaulota bacterium]|nr:CPBP family intramembrane metalloprotease [Candidatus Bipolaricaulota bacterium]
MRASTNQKEIVLGLILLGYLILMRDITTWLFTTFEINSGWVVLCWFFLGLPLIAVPIWKKGNKLGWETEKYIPYFIAGFIGGTVIGILLHLSTLSTLELGVSSNPPYLLIFQLFVFSFFVAGPQEESLFRGYIQPALEERYGRIPGLLLTSALFGLAHLGFLNLQASLIAVILGIFMGYLRDKTGTLLAPYGFHGAVSFVGPVLILLSGGTYTII